MAFSDWFPSLDQVEDEIWYDAVETHLHWIDRLEIFDVPTIIGTRPKRMLPEERVNSSWIWHKGTWRDVHEKNHLPDEEGFWEASWYHPGAGDIGIIRIGQLKLGILICTELWFMNRARDYSKTGIHLLMVPRSTPTTTTAKWLIGGAAAAVIAGAYSLSSNHSGMAPDSMTKLGGVGWISDPEGTILEQSSSEQPWVTLDLDETIAEVAKTTYPRYVQD